MPKIRERFLTFRPSTAVDVVGYRLFYVAGPGPLADTDPSVDVAPIDRGNGILAVQIGAALPNLAEGAYSFGLASVDDVGNVSDIATVPAWTNVAIDVEAPDSPSPVGIESD